MLKVMVLSSIYRDATVGNECEEKGGKPGCGMLIDMSLAIKVNRRRPASSDNPGLTVREAAET